MTDIKIRPILKPSLDGLGLSVIELLELLDLNDDLVAALLKSLSIEDVKDDFIDIKGAKILVEAQKGINKGFDKEDLVSSLENISIATNDKLKIIFHDLTKNEYFSNLNLTEIETSPIYSSKSDFFSWLYGMDKYANELVRNGLDNILMQNIELLKKEDISTTERKYRILVDLNDHEYSLRAITSLSRYHNYDNNITIVIALLYLHRNMKKSGTKYALNRVEYSASVIRIFIEEENRKKFGELGYVKNVIEVSNDEVKREALKFYAIANIEFVDESGMKQDLIIQPSPLIKHKIKTNILSIPHSTGPKKFIDKLEELNNSVKIHDELFDSISKVSQITNPLEIIHLVRQKVNQARDEEFKKYKNKIQKMLDSHTVTNMIQLLSLFKKMELIVDNNIEANEYIRYIVYESLIVKR